MIGWPGAEAVTAPLFWLDGERLAAAVPGARVVLDGPEGRHAATVRRIGPGEAVGVSDGAGRIARCTVASAERASLQLTVDSVEDVPAPALRFVLVQALAKGGRSVVVWRGERASKSHAKWVEVVWSAAKQSRRPRVPSVADPVTTAQLGRMLRAPEVAVSFVLHERAGSRLGAAELPLSGEVVLVVGPEGGVSPQELDVLAAAGARPVRLGREVLRSSTAGTAALAALSVLSGRW